MTNIQEWPTALDRRRRFVTSCDDTDDGTVVVTRDGDRVVIDGRADLAAARRVGGAFRRIDRVAIVLPDAGSADAVVHAVGHRLPVQRRVSVGAALGLARLGIPTVVETAIRGEA